jgi:DivIVA domain-containing protein
MIDESFRLTPVDVRRYDFGRKLNGYDPAKVDAFKEQVAAELEDLIRQNGELDAKAKGLVEQLRAYRERDKALNEALVSAQQLRGDIREQAEREGQLIIREARADAEKLLDGARAEARRVEAEISSLERMRRAFIAQLRALAERHLQEIDAIDAVSAQRPDTRDDDAPPRGSGTPTPAWLNSLVKE